MIVLDVHEILSPAHHIIFMEHIPNGELFDVLASPEPSVAGKPLSEGTSRRILQDVISGMAECYRYGVTHRDLKPEPGREFIRTELGQACQSVRASIMCGRKGEVLRWLVPVPSNPLSGHG